MGPATIGLDVGGTKILGVVLDGDGVVLVEQRVPTPRMGDALIAALALLVDDLRRATAGTASVTAVGGGLLGLVDRGGVWRFAPNLPGIVELPVGPILAAETGLPVALDNDATCALRAEHTLGAARDAHDAVLLTFGTGIGAGMVVDGSIVRGANGFAGEAGHMVVEVDGVPCPCGRRGCWERYASGTFLGRRGREEADAGHADAILVLADGDPFAVRGEHVTAAARAGDAVGRRLVQEMAEWVAIGLVNLVQLLDTRRFVLGGGVAEAADVILEPVRGAFDRRAVSPDHRPGVEIVVAELGEQAGAIGAALLARNP